MLKIGGYQKLSLQDFPGHVAALCFTSGCQLRCPYCHNPELVLPKNSHAESYAARHTAFFDYLSERRHLIDAVVISGGEPLIQKDLIDTLHTIRQMNLAIKLDTNGLCPDVLERILGDGLIDYVSLDYKNIWTHWPQTVGLRKQSKTYQLYEAWSASLQLLQQSPIAFELRTTVIRELHPPAILEDMALELHARGMTQTAWFLQAFTNNGAQLRDWLPHTPPISLSAYSLEEMRQIEQSLKPWTPAVQLRIH